MKLITSGSIVKAKATLQESTNGDGLFHRQQNKNKLSPSQDKRSKSGGLLNPYLGEDGYRHFPRAIVRSERIRIYQKLN